MKREERLQLLKRISAKIRHLQFEQSVTRLTDDIDKTMLKTKTIREAKREFSKQSQLYRKQLKRKKTL